MADWTLGTGADEHLDEHNLFDHDGIATPTAGKVLGVSGGKYTQVDSGGGTGDHDSLTGVSTDDHHPQNHQARHQAGGADALTGNLNATARTLVRKNSVLVAARRQINFIEGSGVTLTVTDDVPNEEVDVTITSSGGSGGGLTVSHLSTNTTVSGSGVYIMDTSGGNRTITLPSLSGTPSDGYRIQVIRNGSNYVYVVPSGIDEYWDTTTQRTIWDDYGAVSLAAGTPSSEWLELGRWRTVT